MARTLEEIEADREAVKARLEALEAEREEVDAGTLIALARGYEHITLPDAGTVYDWFLTAVGRAIRNTDDYADYDVTQGRLSVEFDGIELHMTIGLPLESIEDEDESGDDAEAA